MKTLRTSRLINSAVVLLFAVSGMVTPTAQACLVRAYTETFTSKVSPPIVVGECYYACDGSVSCWGETSGEYTNESITFHEFCGPCDPE